VLKTRLIALLIAAVLVWGAIHALGAYLFNHDLRRAAVVLACVFGFLGFWGLLLWRRRGARPPLKG
jgi:predicted permease